jgi:hypothetical protein
MNRLLSVTLPPELEAAPLFDELELLELPQAARYRAAPALEVAVRKRRRV